MKSIKLRSLIKESLGEGKDTFTEHIQYLPNHNKHCCELEINNAPKEVYDIINADGDIEFSLELNVRQFGIESVSANLIKVEIDLEYQPEEDDDKTETLHIKATNNISVEVGDITTFPLYVTNFVLDMHNTMDDNKFTYEMSFGNRNNNLPWE